MGYVHRSCNNSIRDEYRAPAWVDKVSNTVKGPIHNTVGETGKFEKVEFREVCLPVDLTWMTMVILSKVDLGGEEG